LRLKGLATPRNGPGYATPPRVAIGFKRNKNIISIHS